MCDASRLETLTRDVHKTLSRKTETRPIRSTLKTETRPRRSIFQSLKTETRPRRSTLKTETRPETFDFSKLSRPRRDRDVQPSRPRLHPWIVINLQTRIQDIFFSKPRPTIISGVKRNLVQMVMGRKLNLFWHIYRTRDDRLLKITMLQRMDGK